MRQDGQMHQTEQREYINRLLESLGIGRQYRGHDVASQAICQVLQNEGNLLCLRSQVLKPMASRSQCGWQGLERNLRTAIRRAWQINAPRLQELAAYPLTATPTVTEFIDILSEYVMRQNRQRVGCCANRGECCGRCQRQAMDAPVDPG